MADQLCSTCAEHLKASRMGLMCSACSHTVSASAPPGWEDTVERMKDHPEIDTTRSALAWSMHQKGDQPHDEKATFEAESDRYHLAASRMRVEQEQMHLQADALEIDPGVPPQTHNAPIANAISPEGEPLPEPRPSPDDDEDEDDEGDHPEPDGDEDEMPNGGLVEPDDPHEKSPGVVINVHASALGAICRRAAEAVATSPCLALGGRVYRDVATPPLVYRYTLQAAASGPLRVAQPHLLPELQAAFSHPNKLPFKAILHPVDTPSDRPPNGSYGHRVIIPRAVAEAALPSLIGMGVNVSSGGGQGSHLGGHNVQQKVGVITHASIGADPDPSTRVPGFRPDANSVMVAGWLYAKDFPNEIRAVQAASRAGILGTSYEVSDVIVGDPQAEPWMAESITYTGMAALRKDAAAYQATHLAASAA